MFLMYPPYSVTEDLKNSTKYVKYLFWIVQRAAIQGVDYVSSLLNNKLKHTMFLSSNRKNVIIKFRSFSRPT